VHRPRRLRNLEQQPAHPAEEIKRLQRCINDLVSVFALPAVWGGGEPSQIVRTLLDVLLGMLRLDLVYARLNDSVGDAPIELVRVAQWSKLAAQPQAIGELLRDCLGPDPQKWTPQVRTPVRDISIVPLLLGLQGEIGVIVAGSRRTSFPEQTEILILGVAANLAAIGLQEARLLGEQKRVADILDQRVVQRTRELATANEELRKEIVERKRVQDELKQSEVRKAAILDSALDCIVTINREGRITEFNPAAERTFGHRRDEVMGKHLADVIVPPPLREKHQQGLARYLTTGESRVIGQRVEMTAVRADGSEFPVELAITRIPLDGPPSFTGFLRDITERKQAEEKVRRSEAFLAEGQHLSRIGSFSWRVATDEIKWSEQLYRIFEFEQGIPVTLELIGTRVHPEDIPLFNSMIERVRGADHDFEYEHRLQMPDHSIKYLHLIAHGSRDKEGRLEYIGAAQDVTQRRLSEQALGKARSELAHVARVTSLGVLTASIAHEVNQPLAAIITNGETGLRWLARSDLDVEKVQNIIRRVVADARRASEIIDRIRAMATQRAPQQTRLSLADIIEESMVFLGHEFQSRGISVSLDLAPELPRVVGDRTQLQQVIVNLVINAVQAMTQSESVRRSIIIRTLLSKPENVCCTIEDSGPGIDPAHLPHLFDSFFTTKDTGMGMGLAISRSIIEAHEGHIQADNSSSVGGARFSFALPANDAG
jgi:PAS domain S-box-containing protein